MLTEKDYCNYEICVALRELGFTPDMTEKVYERNLMTNRYETIPKPLLYEAQKWLREEKHLYVEVHWYSNLLYEYKVKDAAEETLAVVTAYKTYEDALSEGIKEAVKILKEDETIHR